MEKNKISYADIVKKTPNNISNRANNINKEINNQIMNVNINCVLNEQKIIKNELTNNEIKIKLPTYFTRIKLLINKIFKQNTHSKKISILFKHIHKIIIHTKNTKEDIISSMIKINDLLQSNNINKTTKIDNKNHIWVSQKLINIFKENGMDNKIKIVDIGGGDGNILNNISDLFEIPKQNMFCIEQPSWHEKYNFKYDINYIFWNNSIINITPKSIDVILIMVTLHHMDNNTLKNLIINVKKILKPNGLIIIKEHDLTDNYIKKSIDWEHHLYHLMMTQNEEITNKHLTDYLDKFINNYKSKKEYDNIFNEFEIKSELNRFFEPFVDYEYANATNLYWKVYKEKSE